MINPLASAWVYVPVTPNDTTDLGLFNGLIVSVGGTLSVVDREGRTRNLTVPAGVLPISGTKVRATGTAATGITAIY